MRLHLAKALIEANDKAGASRLISGTVAPSNVKSPLEHALGSIPVPRQCR
jgi:hypothetical protein